MKNILAPASHKVNGDGASLMDGVRPSRIVTPAVLTTSSLSHDFATIERHAAALMLDGVVLEARVLNARCHNGFILPSEYNTTYAGWFDRPDQFAAEMNRVRGVSVYTTFNRINPDLRARSYNTFARQKHTTKDEDVTAIRWLFLDVDPERPADVSATEAERTAALHKRDAIITATPGLGDAVLTGSSGNGAYILARLDEMANDEAGRKLIADGLKIFGRLHDDEAVKVDQKTKNPARIMAVAGSIKCKGSDIPERPWRVVNLDAVPDVDARFDLAGFVAAHADLLVSIEAESKRPGRPPRATTAGAPLPDVATPQHDLDARIFRATRYLMSMAPAVEGDDGSGQAFDAACALVKGFDLSPFQARPLFEAWNAKCLPPWSDREIDHKLTQADEKPDDKPRGYLFDRDAAQVNGGSEAAGADGKAPPDGKKREVSENAFANADPRDDDAPMHLDLIGLEFHRLTGSPMPYAIDGRLFVNPRSSYEPIWLDNPAALFAYAVRRADGLYWKSGTEYCSKEMFFEHLRQTAPKKIAVESHPHFPPIPGHHYLHRDLPAPSGKLDGLIDFFNPATPAYRELIKAYVATPFWGGPAGARPAFLVTGPDIDSQNGVGVGKSTLTAIASALSGGSIEVSDKDDWSEVKTRALTPSTRNKRTLRLDNLKASRFSWAELEGQVTATEISGRQLYRGDGTRPNTLTVALTINGASLSRDMAARCVVIKLNRPTYRASWESEINAFIERHKWEVIAEIGELLSRETPEVTARTRFATWENGVLAKFGLTAECQELILEQQGSVNDDHTEQVLVAEFFRDKLREHGHRPESCCVAIPSPVAAEWLTTVLRKHFATNPASSHLKVLAIPELTQIRTKTARIWVWRGPEASGRESACDLFKTFG